MDHRLTILQRVEIASPCTASWDAMAGDDRVRFCGQCRLHVYNLSEMTAREAERLILETEGRLCARIYRRADGTIITCDCPVGLAALRRRARWVAARLAAAVLFAAGAIGLAGTAPGRGGRSTLAGVEPFASIHRWLEPAPVLPIGGSVRMGRPAFNPGPRPACSPAPAQAQDAPTAPEG